MDYIRHIFTPDRIHREYDKAFDWLRSNSGHPDIIQVNWTDVSFLHDTGLLDWINQQNGSMLGHYEDDWIVNPDVIRNVIHWMKNRKTELSALEIQIIRLLEKALKEDSYIYFAF